MALFLPTVRPGILWPKVRQGPRIVPQVVHMVGIVRDALFIRIDPQPVQPPSVSTLRNAPFVR